MDLTEAEDIKKRWQKQAEGLYRNDLNDPDNHDGVITHLEPDVLECEVKWASGSITQQQQQEWKRSVSIPISKKGNVKQCSNYRTIALISHASKVMLKILQASLQQYVNRELLDVQLVLVKVEEPEIKLPISVGSLKKQESSRKTSISVLLTMPKPLTVDHNKLWKILKEMGIPEHLTCFLTYAGRRG